MVSLFTKPNCQPCRAMKRKLDAEGVEYRELSITDEENLAAVKELGFLAVPVLLVGDQAVQGFRPDVVDRLAAIAALDAMVPVAEEVAA